MLDVKWLDDLESLVRREVSRPVDPGHTQNRQLQLKRNNSCQTKLECRGILGHCSTSNAAGSWIGREKANPAAWLFPRYVADR